MEGQGLLWWSAVAGINLAPDPRPLGLTQITKANTAEDMSPNSRKWEEILDHGLTRHRKAQRRSSGGDSHRIEEHSLMTIEDVVLAIGSIWAALMNQSNFNKPHVGYAFAGTDIFDPGEFAAGVLGSGVVGQFNKFIMPLFFPPREKEVFEYFNRLDAGEKGDVGARTTAPTKTRSDKGRSSGNGCFLKEQPLGHLVLAVAKRSSSGSKDIRIVVRDSLVGHVNKDVVRLKASTIAKGSSWIGHNDEGNPASQNPEHPFSYSFVDRIVPQQPKASNSCGLSTILNAWAVMLGIPTHQEVKRRSGRSSKDYLIDGLEIVNLALSGFMDSRTIQAWMNVYGFSKRQNPRDSDEGPSFQINAVSMNLIRLQETLLNHRFIV